MTHWNDTMVDRPEFGRHDLRHRLVDFCAGRAWHNLRRLDFRDLGSRDFRRTLRLVSIWHHGAPRPPRAWNPVPPPRLSLEEFQEAAMSHHWRSHVGRADVIQGAGDHDVEYFGGWVISAALTLATVLVVWHFHI